MELEDVVRLSYEELAAYTDNFCEKNYISHFQFGKFYRGKIVRAEQIQYVTVKIFEVSDLYIYRPGDNHKRLIDELILLSHEVMTNHPGMVKLYGYCCECDRFGVVYQFKPFSSVFNLIAEDGFSWLQRIKVALGLASLLKFLHSNASYKPYIVRNLDCAHILIDQDYNPKLCDFSLITGGIFPDRTIYKGHHIFGSVGYIDADALYSDEFTGKQDVFAFGVILVNLITKRVYDVEDRPGTGAAIHLWAYGEFVAYEDKLDNDDDVEKQPKFSIVHTSLEADPDFDPANGRKISALAIECIRGFGSERPTIKQVVRSLLKLKVVAKHTHFLGLNKLLHSSAFDVFRLLV